MANGWSYLHGEKEKASVTTRRGQVTAVKSTRASARHDVLKQFSKLL